MCGRTIAEGCSAALVVIVRQAQLLEMVAAEYGRPDGGCLVVVVFPAASASGWTVQRVVVRAGSVAQQGQRAPAGLSQCGWNWSPRPQGLQTVVGLELLGKLSAWLGELAVWVGHHVHRVNKWG